MPRSGSSKTSAASTSLMVRLDAESKASLVAAARLRRVSVSDYVRTTMVAQARRELLAAQEQVLALTPDEQLAFWRALEEPSRLTPAQHRLGAVMRGEE